MNQLKCVQGKFFYGAVPVQKPFVRVLVRQITASRAEVQIERQRRAFKIIAERQGW